jgi:hypothetical protein
LSNVTPSDVYFGREEKSSKEGRKPSLNQYKKEDKNIYNKS